MQVERWDLSGLAFRPPFFLADGWWWWCCGLDYSLLVKRVRVGSGESWHGDPFAYFSGMDGWIGRITSVIYNGLASDDVS